MQMDWKKTILSDPSENFLSNPRPALDEPVTISLRIHKDAAVEAMFLFVCPIGEGIYYKMERVREESFFAWYQIEYKISVPRLDYKFFMVIDGHEWYYTPLGLTSYESPDAQSFTIFAGDDLSDWTPESIFYQIFPDRFCREGNTELGETEITLTMEDEQFTLKRKLSKWDDPGIKTTYENLTFQFYGGTFKGITKNIPYLTDLGITAIYLNPVYPAISSHRYDVGDYTGVDPLLGTEEDLADCINALHKAGIKIIFDGVLNHTGFMHPWFDVEEKADPPGAYASRDSSFYDFYYFDNHPDGYASWMGSKILPKLQLENPEVRRRLLHADDSAIKQWLHKPFNIDGWRLDTANLYGKFPKQKFDRQFSKELHQAIKSVNPQAFIVAETFFDPADLVGNDAYESAMNYRGFMLPLKKWLIGEFYCNQVPRSTKPFIIDFSVESFINQIRSVRQTIPFQNQLRMFNLLDSHDTSRFYTDIGTSFERFKMGLVLQFTYIGVPSIYYGDEIGMEGEGDPDCRRPMLWNKEDQDPAINELYKKLIKLRNNSRALQYGSFIDLYASDNLLAWCRLCGDEAIITICNADEQEQAVTIPLEILGIENGTMENCLNTEIINFANYRVEMKLAGNESKIFSQKIQG